MRTFPGTPAVLTSLAIFGVALAFPSPGQARVVDDFNGGKVGWTDFPAVDNAQLIPPTVVQNDQFLLDIPQVSVGLSDAGLFTSSVKTTEEFTIVDGRTVEFRVDMVRASGNDAYGVLAFVPDGIDPKQTVGYSLAKSANEILLVKALDHYFVDDDTATGAVKHTNITMVLSLTGKGADVVITGRILDKDNNNAVLWERTTVDTSGADFGNEAELGPAQKPFLDPVPPSLGKGRFGIYLYALKRTPLEDNFSVVFDNAQAYVMDHQTLDDFGSGKGAWTDFPVVDNAQLIPPTVVQNGQFVFDIPSVSVGLSDAGLFTSSVQTSKEFTIQEGEHLEFSVGLVQGAGNDAYAVVAFVPDGVDPKQTLGYSLAKSANEILLVKALDHYLLDDDNPTGTVKHTNVTMVLSLSGQGGNVLVSGKILDKDNNNTLLWEGSALDTAGADFGNEGELGPGQKPLLGKGRFALYLYAIKRTPLEDTFKVVYDNARVAAPPAAATNQPPVISQVVPATSANFLPSTTVVSFTAVDDKDIPEDNVAVALNGTTFTRANGLVVNGAGTNRSVTLPGKLVANVNYKAELTVIDSDGVQVNVTSYFDTFTAQGLVVEVEDYDYGSGQYINDPRPTPEGSGPLPNSYSYQAGSVDIDYFDTRTSPSTDSSMYRPDDNVRMQHSLDRSRSKYQDAGGVAASVYDYDLGDIAPDEWLNYTRRFAAGTYEVYLRESMVNIESARSDLYQVTPQATNLLGSFLGTATGFNYRNFALTDGAGVNKIVLRLSGPATLRLQQVTGDPDGGNRFENYLVFVPVAESGIQRATVSQVTPAADTLYQSAFLRLNATILNRETTVNVSTVKLQYDGQDVPATVTPSATGASVSYTVPVVPPPDLKKTAQITFQDNQGVDVTTKWSFALSYLQLSAANAQIGTGSSPGFLVHLVQEDKSVSSDLIDSTAQAERQLALQNSHPPLLNVNSVESLVNFTQDENPQGYFQAPDFPDLVVPGLTAEGGTDDFSVEAKAWLQLKAGSYRFGVLTDDGFKLSAGATLDDKTPILMTNDGTSDQTVDFVAPIDGFYPFRMIWYERGGQAHAEWFSVDPVTGKRALVNDPASPIKAFTVVKGAPARPKFDSPTLANGTITITWTGTGVLQHSSDLKTWADVPGQPQSPYRFAVAASGSGLFYRLH